MLIPMYVFTILFVALPILYLFLLILVSAELLFATFLAQDNKFVILHFVIINLSTGNFDSTCGYVVQESAVMTD